MDAHLRGLERRAELGDLTSRAQLFAERVRRGVLAPERLELAAGLGDPAAGCALDRSEAPGGIAAVLSVLAGRGPHLVRLLSEAASLCLGSFELWLPLEEGPQAAVAVAANWLERPDVDHSQACHRAAAAARAAAGRVTYALLPRHQLAILSRAEITAMEYVAWTAHDAAEGALRCGGGGDSLPDTSSLLRLEEARRESGWDGVGELATRACGPLIAWLLDEAA